MLTRRHMLKGLGGLAATPLFFRSMAAEAAGSNNTILVTILLQGGNDGLNTVVPLQQYGSYAGLRTPANPPPGLALAYTEQALSTLAFNSNPSTPANQATQFAFAPSMTAMRSLYATGKLAVVAGVGLPAAEMNPLSHYEAQLDWQTGQVNINGSPPAGWLGLTLAGAQAGKLGPVASLNGSSPIITTSSGGGLVLPSPIDNYGLYLGDSDNYVAMEKTFASILAMQTQSASAASEQAVVNTATGDIQTVKSIAAKQSGNDYPSCSTPLDFQLRDIARMILGGAGIRGYAALQAGYDTHANQALSQPGLVADLGTAMSNFYSYLQGKGASSNVVIMTISDFGRRPAANLDFGTDHGGGGLSFILGDSITGGVFGTYPSLTQLDQNQNLAVSVDFRNVISDVIGAMGGNAATILGQTYPRLGFI